MKPYCLAVLALLTPAVPGTCQDTVTNTAQQTKHATTSRIKGWFQRHHTPNSERTKQKALQIPTGSPVKVTSTEGTSVKGTLAEVTNDGIQVKTSQGPAQSFAYDRISSLKKTHGPKAGKDGTPNTGKVEASLGNIPPGSSVNLKLTDQTKLSGRYRGRTAEGVKVQTPQGGKMVERTIPRDQIVSVHPDKPGLVHKPQFQSPDLVKKTVSGIPVGSPLSIKTPDGKNVSGKLTEVTESGFSLQTLEGSNIVSKDLPYEQVASVKRPHPGIKQQIPGLHPPALQSGSQIKAAALEIPAGSPVMLQRPDGSKTTGKLMGVTNDGIQVQSLQAGNVVTQNVGFDQIGSIKQGVPVTPTDRAKKYGKAAAMVIVTGAISGALARAF